MKVDAASRRTECVRACACVRACVRVCAHAHNAREGENSGFAREDKVLSGKRVTSLKLGR